VPGGLPDLGQALQLADRAVTGTEQHVGYPWFLLARGMADYRAGHFESALERLAKTLSLVGEPHSANSRCLAGTAHAFLAMAYHRLDQALEARQALARAAALRQQQKHPGADWHNWWRVDIVYQEAERLVNRGAEFPEGRAPDAGLSRSEAEALSRFTIPTSLYRRSAMIDRLTNIADAVATGVSRRRFFAQVSACGAGLAALLSGSKVGAQNPHQVKITSDLYNVTFQPLF